MSAITIIQTSPRPKRSLWLWVLVAILATLVVWAVLDLGNAHSVSKHGNEAWAVRTCSNDMGYWINPVTGRQARTCQLDDGRFGIQIIEDGREVTSFIKEKMRHIEQVIRYLRNRGYVPADGLPQ